MLFVQFISIVLNSKSICNTIGLVCIIVYDGDCLWLKVFMEDDFSLYILNCNIIVKDL